MAAITCSANSSSAKRTVRDPRLILETSVPPVTIFLLSFCYLPAILVGRPIFQLAGFGVPIRRFAFWAALRDTPKYAIGENRWLQLRDALHLLGPYNHQPLDAKLLILKAGGFGDPVHKPWR